METASRIIERDFRSRVLTVLAGGKPDRIPFVDRLELWFKSHSREGTLPHELVGLSLEEIHRRVGMGQQLFLSPYGLKLRGVEMVTFFNGEAVHRETGPVIESFPGLWDIVQTSQPGTTITRLLTPIGSISMVHQLLPEMVASGQDPYVKKPWITEEADFRTVEYILEHSEFTDRFEHFRDEEGRIGKTGFLVPLLPRIPFQQMLLDYVGEIGLFYALEDEPERVGRLIRVIHSHMVEMLAKLESFRYPYVEFGDNLTGDMTNPRLFRAYCMPHYQAYAEILHDQGKTMGSHTDGNLKPLLQLIPESGLDVCESFSPFPLSRCSFEEAWGAWSSGPLIWGGIPSPILEARTPEPEFRKFVSRILGAAEARPLILGVGDMVLGNNLIDRVRYIADLVEEGGTGG